jgi:hypothetical protein
VGRTNMIFRPTKDVQKKLKINHLDTNIENVELLDEWLISIFSYDRKRYFISTNAYSLYSVISNSLGITNFELYKEKFIDDLFMQIKMEGFFKFFETAIGKSNNETRIGKTNNRSILGSMNDFIFQAQYFLENELPLDASRHVNESPMSYLGMENPNSIIRKYCESNK